MKHWKVLAVFLAAALAMPASALAQSETVGSPLPMISREAAISIVKQWGVDVTSAELGYENGRNVWYVYGTYTTYIGPRSVTLDVVAKLDASDGSLIGLEIDHEDNGRERVIEMLREYGISVQELYLIDAYTPYWEVYGSKGMDVAGRWVEVPLTIRVDAQTLNVLEVYVEPRYYIQGAQAEPTGQIIEAKSTKPVPVNVAPKKAQ